MNLKKAKKFLVKLFTILDDQEYFDIISWDSSGTSVIIKNLHRLEIEIVPTFFNMTKISSFIRQLHIYNFKKLRNTSPQNVLIYHNQLFDRQKRDLAKNIARKRKTVPSIRSTCDSQSHSSEILQPIKDNFQRLAQKAISIQNIEHHDRTDSFGEERNISTDNIFNILGDFEEEL